jgi:putative membrane protein
MATDHTLANKRLAAIARYLGRPFHPQLTHQDIALKNKLQGLSGRQFDTQYMQAMVRDHEKDIQAFEQEAQNGQAEPLKMYARNMLPVIREHFAEARQLAGAGGVATGAGGRATTGSGSSIQHYNR